MTKLSLRDACEVASRRLALRGGTNRRVAVVLSRFAGRIGELEGIVKHLQEWRDIRGDGYASIAEPADRIASILKGEE